MCDRLARGFFAVHQQTWSTFQGNKSMHSASSNYFFIRGFKNIFIIAMFKVCMETKNLESYLCFLLNQHVWLLKPALLGFCIWLGTKNYLYCFEKQQEVTVTFMCSRDWTISFVLFIANWFVVHCLCFFP